MSAAVRAGRIPKVPRPPKPSRFHLLVALCGVIAVVGGGASWLAHARVISVPVFWLCFLVVGVAAMCAGAAAMQAVEDEEAEKRRERERNERNNLNDRNQHTKRRDHDKRPRP